ncbi:COG1361 S-layer family protein [Marinicella sediminis]|uniref:COG1361 S-layer family protein n=1 Tax=Marinicella sediminis TaxID=1792834 RepID=A0ABV7JHI5_9GAMM|nr:DUF11 domain-containing protein [Marinicella sediminis]
MFLVEISPTLSYHFVNNFNIHQGDQVVEFTINIKKQSISVFILLTLFTGIVQAGGSTADLSVTKTDGVTAAVAGGSVTYTMVVTNNGPDDVTGVTVADTFPAALTNCSTTCVASAGSACTTGPVAGNLNDTLVDLLNAGTATYTSTCDIPSNAAAGGLSNTVTVTEPVGTTDPAPGNNSATDSDTVIGIEADLSITKVDDVDPVSPGGTLTYTIDVSNAGPSDATNVVVTDTLPGGVTFVSTTGCAEDPNGNPTCSLGTITAGSSASYTLQVTVDATTGTITNNASVTSDATDNTPGNNSTSEDTVVQPEIDLSITKSDDVDPVAVGGNVTYTIDVANAGPSDATNVVVTDTLPAGMTLVSTSGCAEDPAAVPTCTLGTIVSGSSAQYNLVVSIDPGTGGTLTNNASVTATETDTNAGNNSTSETTDVTSITITSATPDPSTVGEGVTVAYTVTGSAPTGNVTVSDGVDSCVDTVAAGSCVINLTTVGTRSLVADYAGDGTNPPVTSGAEPHEVVTGSVTLAIVSANPNPVQNSAPTTVTFTIDPVPPAVLPPTGTVTISDGTFSCVATLPDTSCVLVISESGDRNLTASYSGDANYAATSSAILILTVFGNPIQVPSTSLLGLMLLALFMAATVMMRFKSLRSRHD